MSTDVKTSSFQNKPLEGIYTTADNAKQEMEAKREQYESAMGQLNIYDKNKYVAYREFQHAQSGKNKSLFQSAQTKYSLVCNDYSDADINVSVLRDSFMSSIFYSGKMNNCAALANAIAG